MFLITFVEKMHLENLDALYCLSFIKIMNWINFYLEKFHLYFNEYFKIYTKYIFYYIHEIYFKIIIHF